MVIDIKYYIITIAVIFISLGIGIIIGFNMNGEQIYLTQQQQLIDSLEDTFAELRTEGDNLRKKVEKLEKEKEESDVFIEKAYYEIVNNKLSDLTIAIVQTTENYYYNDVQEVLKGAGAIIPMHLLYTEKFFNLTKEELGDINYFFGLELTKSKLINQINNDIIGLLIDNRTSNLLDYLIDNEFIQLIHYKEYTKAIDQVIVAGGYQNQDNERINLIDLNLINKLQDNNITVIGIERSDVSYSCIPSYERKGIPTIDNVETLSGRISLILLSSGREEDFGKLLNKGVI